MEVEYKNPVRMILKGQAIWAECETGGLVKIVGTGGDKYVAVAVQESDRPRMNGNLNTPLFFLFNRLGPKGKAGNGFRVIQIEKGGA